MMPAGTYYIGDLCYVMDNDEWAQFCTLTIQDENCVSGEFAMPDGRRFASYTTAHGDGTYRSNIGSRHCVDAGLLGCILVKDIISNKYGDLSSLGAVVNFEYPFSTSECDGVIKFGHVRIDTAD